MTGWALEIENNTNYYMYLIDIYPNFLRELDMRPNGKYSIKYNNIFNELQRWFKKGDEVIVYFGTINSYSGTKILKL
ncbi:MAG: hypothetical protein CR986_09030 [Ignavibacteriae bacterium]|nr:MAG: hypothetical protein CR986_09030 [Ignavibacteriota bacterium]